MKQTGNVKANIMRGIKEAFPSQVNPLAGGLGNRDGDAIAYKVVGIPEDSIYIIDTNSEVHKLSIN